MIDDMSIDLIIDSSHHRSIDVFIAALDRYAALNVNFVLVASDRMAVLAARSAAGDPGNQPRGSAGISRGGTPWLVAPWLMIRSLPE
jgi:hypothetical protein